MPTRTENPAAAVILRLARPGDLAALIPLVRDYHATEGIDASAHDYPAVLMPLLTDASKGRIWFVELGARIVGYVAVCLCYSIEFGGVDAFVDELYIEPARRGRGIGSRALELAIEEARALGARALHLEVDTGNEPALRLYRARGFAVRTRYQLMSQHLGTHTATE